MYWHKQTNAYVNKGQSFALNNINYPSNWLDCATENEIAQIGLTKVKTIGERGDEALFDNTEVLDKGVLTITNTPKPPAPREIPPSVSRFQGLAAMLQVKDRDNRSMLDKVRDAVSQSNDELLKLAWENVQVFERHSYLLEQMSKVLGLTDAELDDLFVFAATIKG